MQKSKIESLLGFCINAGKMIFGSDNVTTCRKRIHLIIIDETLSNNSKERVLRFAEMKAIPVLASKNLLENIIFKPNCKVVGITDKQMSTSMLNFTNEDFNKIECGGNIIEQHR